MAQTATKMSSNRTKLYVDIFLFISFVLVNIPQATGIPVHEWASVLFIIPLLVHILLDWNWIVSVTKRMFGRLPGEVRFNHIFDLVIFIMMTLALMTGFVISEAALPAIGIHVIIDPFWSSMHDLTANLTMLLIGIHLAMHWKWIVNSCKRYFGRNSSPSKTTPETTIEGAG